jgi:hypothetical protein
MSHCPGVSAGRLWRAVNGHLRLKSIEAPHGMARRRRSPVSASLVPVVGRCGCEGESIHPRRPRSFRESAVEGWRARADARGAALLLCVPSANDVGPAHHADCDDAELPYGRGELGDSKGAVPAYSIPGQGTIRSNAIRPMAANDQVST